MLIKYIKSVLWRVARRLSYIQDARCLKVKSAFHKTRIASIITQACPAWKSAAAMHLSGVQRLQICVIRTIDNFENAQLSVICA